MNTLKQERGYKELLINEHERQEIIKHNGLCYACVESIFKRSGFTFDDIERLTNTFEKHKWGSDADRRYRSRLINKAIRAVADKPLQYIDLYSENNIEPKN